MDKKIHGQCNFFSFNKVVKLRNPNSLRCFICFELNNSQFGFCFAKNAVVIVCVAKAKFP